ncbi:MAG: neutral/alkaline non-lysosomal ceramidase N-terminal domain-containing protein [Thermofilaceae archaeon]|nr:neutral/alkaline non-lysosomal ceramidase N-terminal domain-containing protein [Thermofilaceae archaeon]MCX8180160.1 neutral/alkaline non-lysosomal ceramidase N-terminal domain-containing protein [Thermofilaceae archaeon]MDW8004184.1 neutral/alkaline non-lysosomal ceramidase N-terminal domain-containing protein [Thermofilaceae archaeon]
MSQLKVGIAERVITPPIGVPMGGYALRSGPAKGVHDNLHARALVIELGSELFVLVSLELLYPTQEIVEKLRTVVWRELGANVDNIMVTAVHTHSGPSVFGIDSEPERSCLDHYWRLVPSLVASAVLEANERVSAAKVRLGKGRLDGWTVNRRKPQSMLLDNDVLTILFEDSEGPKAAIVNFACHAVVLGHNNLFISADYPGAVSRTFERLTSAKTIFLPGACGDINPMTPGTSLENVYDRSIGTFRDVEEMGTAIACEAVKSIMGQKPSEVDVLSSKRCRVELETLKIPEVKPEEVEILEKELEKKSAEELTTGQLRTKLALARWSLEAAHRLQMRARGSRLTTEVQAVRLGQTAIVGLPGEPFVEVGLEVKSFSPSRLTIVASYTNDAIGYVPTLEVYDEGGYEVTPPACLVAKGSAEKLTEEALRLLRSLFQGGTP